jgi:hypothetical protein
MTTNTYLGMSRPTSRTQDAALTLGTSSTSTLEVELRMSIVTSGGHYLTAYDILCALEQFRRFILKGGINSAGTNLPIGAPNPTDPSGV